MKRSNLEENYTKSLNSFLKQVCIYRFASVLEQTLVLAIHRFTAGFHKQQAPLSLRFLAEYVQRPYTRICPAINELVRKKVIILVEDKSKANQPRVFSINMNFDEWEDGVLHMGTASNDGVPLDENSEVPVQENSGVPFYDNKKRKITDNINKEVCDSYGYGNGNKTEPDTDAINTRKSQSKKRKCKALKFDDIIIPPELSVVPGFTDHYKEWYEYRKEIGHPLTPTAARNNIKFLTEQHQKGADPIALILHSINNGYRGLFELPQSKKSSQEIYNSIKSNNEHLRL